MCEPRRLPIGVYIVSDLCRDREGELEVTFRGQRYKATIGVDAFGFFSDMSQHAQQVPQEPFCGRSWDKPVAIVPAGVHTCPMGRIHLPIKLERAIAILGEGAGISPNAPQDMSKPNPARNMAESVLKGSLYYGTLGLLDGVEGVLTLDGLTLDGFRAGDRRTRGTGLGVEVRNCILLGAHHGNVVDGYPLTDPDARRTVIVSDCRSDGFDSMEGQGRFIDVCAHDLLVERVYYANTKEFFGLTDYGRERMNVLPDTPAHITLRECVFDRCTGVRGLSFALPQGAKEVHITVEDCTFRDFTPADVPAVYAVLPNDSCALTLRGCTFASTRGAQLAVMIDGAQTVPVTLENNRLDGVAALSAYKPPRRTEAPEYVGEVVWGEDRLDDPHTPVEDGEAMAQLQAMYFGLRAMHGDMHTHSNSGGTSDGKTPLPEFVRQLRELGLDFAAIVDHKQIRHSLLPEWDDTMLICGTEPGTAVTEEGRSKKAGSLHYCMLFQHPSDFFRVMEAFPEFEFTGGPDGHYKYPGFTRERFEQLGRFIYSLGGLMVHAHPKQVMVSDDPEHYYFGEHVPLETILGHANSFDTVQNRDLWVQLLKRGKRVRTHGDSDTHAEAKNCALTTVYTRERSGAAVLRQVREGDCSAGAVGVKMAISGTRMGGSLPWREGLTLAVEVGDFYGPALLADTVYCLKVYTDRGLAYASEFDGTRPQTLTLPVKQRKYYRVEVTNESDGFYVAVSNPIWLD